MSKNKHFIFLLLFVMAMLANALHTIADHHSHTDCQVCVVDDHSNATVEATELPLDYYTHHNTIKLPVARIKWHISYLIPFGHAPPFRLI
ncbi:MAG: hypothetical protein DRG24_07475 [Epsilonproteobacteria bacterium]|nr:MAG: hypothetical protein DRG24_07475 [Campylobacterota bacterium]